MKGENNDNETVEKSFSSFDGQWDVIKRGTAEHYKKEFDNRPLDRKYFDTPCSEDSSSDRFIPPIKHITSSDAQTIELFRSNSQEECNLDRTATGAIAGALLEMRSVKASTHLQPAGYTYFAQLLTHDIVPSTSLLRTRDASCALNLDSIYFDYKKANRWRAVDDDGKFVFCDSDTDLYRVEWDVDSLSCLGYEIPAGRKESYHFAVTPDHRNDGNAILSQLVVFWQKIHNDVVDLLVENAQKDSQELTGSHYYEKARQVVVLLFQEVVINDLLNRTLDQDTFDYYFSYNGPSLFKELDCEEKVVPKEFTHAVSRYAHSMIRPRYFLNKDNHSAVPVDRLFNKNRPLKGAEDNLLISNWDRFFASKWYPSDSKRSTANIIELKASSLPVSSGPLEMRSNPAKNLATFDIEASFELCPFSKVLKRPEVNEFLRTVKGIDHAEIEYFDKIDYRNINNKLKSLGMNIELDNSNAPFFVSMYLEPTALRHTHTHDHTHDHARAHTETHNKDRLGVVASIIYAETMRMSIQDADTNILQETATLQRSLDWAYPVYQSIVSSLESKTMMGLVNFNKLKK